MSNEYWRPWKKESIDNRRPSNESTSQIAYLEDMQKLVLTCYKYFCNDGEKKGALNQSVKAILCKCAIERIVEKS